MEKSDVVGVHTVHVWKGIKMKGKSKCNLTEKPLYICDNAAFEVFV